MVHGMGSLRHGHTNWQHTCTKPYKQAEKGQLLTGPMLIRTQFHNFLLYFWEQKKKNKNKCEDHRNKQVKLNDSVQQKKSMQEKMII